MYVVVWYLCGYFYVYCWLVWWSKSCIGCDCWVVKVLFSLLRFKVSMRCSSWKVGRIIWYGKFFCEVDVLFCMFYFCLILNGGFYCRCILFKVFGLCYVSRFYTCRAILLGRTRRCFWFELMFFCFVLCFVWILIYWYYMFVEFVFMLKLCLVCIRLVKMFFCRRRFASLISSTRTRIFLWLVLVYLYCVLCS